MDSKIPLPVNPVTASCGRLNFKVDQLPALTTRLGSGVCPVLPGTPTNSIGPLPPPFSPIAPVGLVSRNPNPTFNALSVCTSNHNDRVISTIGLGRVAALYVTSRNHGSVVPVKKLHDTCIARALERPAGMLAVGTL
ncbi:MAG: hypothetical protein BWX68_02647 [Verrucomicrobia bacterium ADurb.Bin063]|nr:MAG: hypothetical protein BWX68_02647 [Verrucomicrobia bacterium ADurb.Bin063]